MAEPAFNTIYQFYRDEVARLATITIEDDTSPSLAGEGYGPENLVDDNPAKLAKIDATSGAWIFEYPAKQVIEVAALIHHTFDETVDDSGSPSEALVRLEGNSSSDFSSPAFVAPFVIPAWFGVGTRRWPMNPYLVLTDLEGYDPEGFQFWRLVIESNSQNIQLGQVWFGETLREFDPDVKWGLRIQPDKPLIENRTAFGVSTIYPRGTTIWAYEADLMATDDLADALEAHWYDQEGRARPFLLIPSGPGPDDRCYLVRYAMTDRQAQWNFQNVHDMHLAFQEVGRGLRPGV